MSGKLLTVTVTWTDRSQETYRCADAHTGTDGMLYLNQNRYPANGEPQRRIPLVNIRIWTEDDD